MPDTNGECIKPSFTTIQTLLPCDHLWGALIYASIWRGFVQKTIKMVGLGSYRYDARQRPHEQGAESGRDRTTKVSISPPFVHTVVSPWGKRVRTSRSK